MKKFLSLTAFILVTASVFCQPQVYFDFVTHNEETTQWNGAAYYTNNRTKLISLANYFHTNGVTWNMQSDWVFLTNVLNQETPALQATTNNKNILRWLHEDKGVEMDPHAHESQYLYPDVVKLMDSIGLPESKLMGGTIYNDHNGMNIWTNLVDGQYGLVFPDKFWRPDYMMGGGTPNHVADIKYYGFWNPKSPDEYLVHDTTNHLRHIGLGCEMKIDATTTVSDIVSDIKDVVSKVHDGQYPPDGFYVQSIFFEQGDLNNPAFYAKVIQVADSVNVLVANGLAQWKTLKQAYTLWESAYHAETFQWNCGQLVSSAAPDNAGSGHRVFPNPFCDKILLDHPDGTERYVLTNATGQLVWAGEQIEQSDFSNLPGGMYFLRIESGSAAGFVVQKLVKR